MKTNAIVRIVIFSLVILLLTTLLLAGMGAGFGTGAFVFNLNLGSSGDYISGDGSVPADDVDVLNINWASGSVRIKTHSDDFISFSEEGHSSSNQRMVYEHSGSTLTISYSEPSVQIGFVSTPEKDLTITVPEDWICDTLCIDSASTDAKIENLTVNDVDLDSASNTFAFLNCQVGTLDMDGASNSLDFSGTLDKLDCDGMSSSITAALSNVPSKIDLDGMSGSLDITLPADCGFRVDMDGLDNSFHSDFDTTALDGSYIHGSGGCHITVDGMSSDVTIRKGE